MPAEIMPRVVLVVTSRRGQSIFHPAGFPDGEGKVWRAGAAESGLLHSPFDLPQAGLPAHFHTAQIEPL